MSEAPRRLPVGRAEVEEALEHWSAERWTAAELKAWVEAVRADGDALVAELLAELDLLEVFLLTPNDVPALVAALHAADASEALAAWARYKEALDLDARSKALKRDRFYRPFCR